MKPKMTTTQCMIEEGMWRLLQRLTARVPYRRFCPNLARRSERARPDHPPGGSHFCPNLARRSEWARPDHPPGRVARKVEKVLNVGRQCSQLNYIYNLRL
jgi:hypothetical protein